jgi:hypothetical protein
MSHRCCPGDLERKRRLGGGALPHRTSCVTASAAVILTAIGTCEGGRGSAGPGRVGSEGRDTRIVRDIYAERAWRSAWEPAAGP